MTVLSPLLDAVEAEYQATSQQLYQWPEYNAVVAFWVRYAMQLALAAAFQEPEWFLFWAQAQRRELDRDAADATDSFAAVLAAGVARLIDKTPVRGLGE